MHEKASVIIPTYNGAAKIGNVLNSLLTQTDQDFETVVVIDGSTDNTLEVVKPFEKLLTNLKIVVQDNCGRACVRNKGAAVASGDILIFYDDDMQVLADSVSKHKQFHLANTGLLAGNQMEFAEKHKTDIQNYKAFLTKRWTFKYKDGITTLDLSNLFFSAANCSMRRVVFDELQGFNARLTDAEDYDLAYRALKKGIQVSFDKGNGAIHNDWITCVSYIKRLRTYAAAHEKLRALYPERYTSAAVRRSSFLKRFIYRIFSFRFWPRIIDQELLLKLLPKRLRYKVYELVIQGLAVEYPNISI